MRTNKLIRRFEESFSPFRISYYENNLLLVEYKDKDDIPHRFISRLADLRSNRRQCPRCKMDSQCDHFYANLRVNDLLHSYEDGEYVCTVTIDDELQTPWPVGFIRASLISVSYMRTELLDKIKYEIYNYV